MVKVWDHRGSVLSPIFTVVIDVVTELSMSDILSEMEYADDLLLMTETFEGDRNKFRRC